MPINIIAKPSNYRKAYNTKAIYIQLSNSLAQVNSQTDKTKRILVRYLPAGKSFLSLRFLRRPWRHFCPSASFAASSTELFKNSGGPETSNSENRKKKREKN